MKDKINANPYFKYLNIPIKLASKKYKLLKPRIAKILDEYNINGSFGAIAKIAGILSTAKSRSVNSITPTTTNKGVAYLINFLPICCLKFS